MSRIDPIPALKLRLGGELARLLTGWNADDIAVVIGNDRARISGLPRGKLARFSLETLIRYLARVRYHVDLTVARERVPRRGARELRPRRAPAE